MNRYLGLVLLTSLALTAAQPARAGLGDCGQPVSSGADPVASDALTALQAAVSLARCGICVCDADGSGSVVATDALLILNKAVGQDVEVTCAACGGPGVSGAVTAPAGTLEDGGVGGGDASLLPVAGAVVDLVEIDASGAETRLLSSTTTDEGGGYSFPTSTGLGSGLMVRALDSGGAPVLSALAVDATTDVDPASQFVVEAATGVIGSALIAGEPPLATAINDFTPSEYNGCVGQARNVTPETPPTDAENLVALINTATGGLLAGQVGAYATNGSLLDLLTGDYWFLTQGVFIEALVFPGTVDVTPDLNERLTQSSGQIGTVTFDGVGGLNASGFTGTDIILSEVSGTQQMSMMANEKINATVTILEEPEDEPAIGAGTYDVSGDGTALLRIPGTAVPSVVSQDGSILGLFIFENDSDSFDRGLGVGIKKATAAGNNLFSGDYHAVDLDTFAEKGVRSPDDQEFRLFGASTSKSEASATGTGSGALSPGAGTDIVLDELGQGPEEPPVDPLVTLSDESFGVEPDEPFTYTVGSDGALTLFENASVFAEGAISDDGSMAVLQFFDINEFQNDILEGSHLFEVLVRKASQLGAATVEGSYAFVGAQVDLQAEFTPGTFNGPSDVNFRATVTTAMQGIAELGAGGVFSMPVLVGDEAGLEEVSFVTRSDQFPAGLVADAVVSLRNTTGADLGLGGTWGVAPDGALTINVAGLTLTGAASADGSLIVVQGGGQEDEELFRLVIFGVRSD